MNRIHRFGIVVTSFALAMTVAGVRAPLSHAQTYSSSFEQTSLASLSPQGTSIVKWQTWQTAGQEYAIAATKWSENQPTPWLIVAKKMTSGKWDPLFIAQTQDAFAWQQFVVGPRFGTDTVVSASFIMDAATGLMSNIYTLWITPSSARIVAHLPGVVAMKSLRTVGHSVEVAGLNLAVTERMWEGKWQTGFLPLRPLLSQATHAVGFVMGWSNRSGKEVKQISVVGSSVIQAKVGDTLSFVPLNSQANNHMLGSRNELGTFSGISVYAALPHTPLKFYQAAQIFSNSVTLSEPGTWTYGIVPPGYNGMTANSQVAEVTVNVTR